MAKLKLTNDYDEENVRRGLMEAKDVRSTEIEALVDTGAVMLALPADVVAKLGIAAQGKRPVKYANGAKQDVPYVAGIKLEVLGREGIFSALVMPAGTTPLLGQIVLEELDLLVDPRSRDVYVNPRSPDAPLIELLRAG